jgi:hypothetical protein
MYYYCKTKLSLVLGCKFLPIAMAGNPSTLKENCSKKNRGNF